MSRGITHRIARNNQTMDRESERIGLQEIIDKALEEMAREAGESFELDRINLAEFSRRTGLTRSRARTLKANGFKVLPHGRWGAENILTLTRLRPHTRLRRRRAAHAAGAFEPAREEEPRVHRAGRNREDAPRPDVREGVLPCRLQDVLPQGHGAEGQAQEGLGIRQHLPGRRLAGEAVVPDSRRGRPVHVRQGVHGSVLRRRRPPLREGVPQHDDPDEQHPPRTTGTSSSPATTRCCARSTGCSTARRCS